MDTRSPLRSFTLEGQVIYFVSSESFQVLGGRLAGISDADINSITVGIKARCALMFVVRVDLLSGPSGRTGSGSRCVVLTKRRMRRWSLFLPIIITFRSLLTHAAHGRGKEMSSYILHLQYARTHIAASN